MLIPQLTFTRFLAAISVVILHFGLFSWPFNTSVGTAVFMHADTAVSFFFTLSGFILVIAQVSENQLPESVSGTQFWKKRIARILPVYLFSILLYFLLEFRYDPNGSQWGQFQPYVYATPLLQSWNYKLTMDVNFPAWSLSVEAFFYLIFPILYRFLVRKSSSFLWAFSLLLWAILIANYVLLSKNGFPENFCKFFPPFHVATFLGGIATGILFVRSGSRISVKTNSLLWLSTIASVVGLVSVAVLKPDWLYYRHNGLLTPFFILVIITLASSREKIARIFSWQPFQFLGEISYSVYLLQVPVMLFCQRYIPVFTKMKQADYFWWYLCILLVFSAIIYLSLEKPSRKLVMKLLSKTKG